MEHFSTMHTGHMTTMDSTPDALTDSEIRRARLEDRIRRKLRLQIDPIWTVDESAYLLGCARETVLAKIRAGRLPAITLGKRASYRVKHSDLVRTP